MKRLSALMFLSPIILVIFLFTSCDMEQDPVGTFGDAVERIPDVQLIEGADNVTMNVNYDRNYSYFRVTISNTGNNNVILDGTYNSWCLQMALPIETNREYTGVRLYSTDRDRLMNALSYVVNNRARYESANPGLSWKDIQVAFWVILETKDMRLASIADRLPSVVQGYNAEHVNNILNDVKQNGMNFKPGFGDKQIILTHAGDNEQSTGIEKCETAWGGNTGFNIQAPGQWWYIFNTSGPATQNIWAGQTTNIGTVTVSAPSNGTRTITINLIPGWILDNVPEAVKIQGFAQIPRNTFTSPPPGLFTTYKGNSLVVNVPDFAYYAIHLDVCKLAN